MGPRLEAQPSGLSMCQPRWLSWPLLLGSPIAPANERLVCNGECSGTRPSPGAPGARQRNCAMPSGHGYQATAKEETSGVQGELLMKRVQPQL